MPASVSRSQKSSSSVGSASSAFLDKLEAEASGADILDNSSALQAGVFGVLFTVTKEKYNTGWRSLLLKLVLDYLQLFTLTFTTNEPWVFASNSVMWRVASVVNIDTVIAPLGYTFFVAILYVMVAGLVLMVGLSLWVAWCFKSRSFPSVWPIKVLRIYANLFFQVLDVLTLTLFQVPFKCHFIGYPKAMFDILDGYPGVVCSGFPHVIHMVVSGLSLLIFVVCALLNLGADFELSPLERGLLSIANAEVEMRAFVIKFAMTFVAYAIGWQRVRLVLQLILSALLTWQYLRWSPHLVDWVNHVRVGLYTSVLLSAVLAVVLVWGPEEPSEVAAYNEKVTTLLWALLAPAALVGAAASYARLNLWSGYVLRRFREAQPGEKARRIYKFGDPREVEIVSRVCRKWTDQHKEVLDRGAVKEGEIVIKAGLQLFPGRCYMLILYSNYLIDVLDNSQTGYSQMAAAKQAAPDWMQRFAIFAREQEQLQRMSSARGGGESGVDLVSYVEYQKNHRLVIRAHKDALIATRTFWQALLHNQVKFTHLASALNEIERTVLKAEAAYKQVLTRYPTNPKLARTYARFLENVVNDPWKAAKYFSEAERLTEQQEADEAAGAEMAAGGGAAVGEAGVENRLLHRVDERVNAVFMINANGIIQMANKNACTLLGYGKGDLDGKNINIIMPPPFSQRHTKYIRHYIHTGRETVLNSVSHFPALHRDRYVIPVRVGVSKPVTQERNEANVYLLPGGTVAAVDRAFVDWFAKQLDDCIAQHLADLTADERSANAVRTAIDNFNTAARSAAAAAASVAAATGRSSVALYNPAAANAVAASAAAASAGGGGGTGSINGVAPTALATQPSSHLVAARSAAPSANGMAPAPVAYFPERTILIWLRHKYAKPVRVSLKLKFVGTGNEGLICATFTRTDPPANLVLVDGRGKIGFITSELATALGASPEGLAKQAVSDLLPQPWNLLHSAGGGLGGWFRQAESSMGNVGYEIKGDHAASAGVVAAAAAVLHGAHLPKAHSNHHGHGSHGPLALPVGRDMVRRASMAIHVLTASSHMNHMMTAIADAAAEAEVAARAAAGVGYGMDGSEAAPPGSCLRGATVILGSSSKVQDYYRVEVSSRGENAEGQPMRVVMVSKSSLQAALDERRLSVVVDAATGRIVEAGDSPQSLFGFKPATLVGRNIADVVAALRPPGDRRSQPTPTPPVAAGAAAAAGSPAAGGTGADAAAAGAGAAKASTLGPMSTTQLLCHLAAVTMAVGGASWRVGVTPPMEEHNLEALGVLKGAFLARQTRAAVMEVDVLVPGGAELEAQLAEEEREREARGIDKKRISQMGFYSAAGRSSAQGYRHELGRQSIDHTSVNNMLHDTQDEIQAWERAMAAAEEDPSVRPEQLPGCKSLLQAPTFQEMHARGRLSVEAAAAIESGLTILTQPGSYDPAMMPEAAAGLRLRLSLWHAEILSGVLECDPNGEVVKVSHPRLHQAGLLWGMSTALLPRLRLSRLLQLPPGSSTQALFEQLPTAELPSPMVAGMGTGAPSPGVISLMASSMAGMPAKRGALKGKQGKVGPPQLLFGTHADQQPLELAVQAVVKDGGGSTGHGRTYVFVKLRNPVRAPDQTSLLRALEAVAPTGHRLLRAARRAVGRSASQVGIVPIPAAPPSAGLPSLAAVKPPAAEASPPPPAKSAEPPAVKAPEQEAEKPKPKQEDEDEGFTDDAVLHLERGEMVGQAEDAEAEPAPDPSARFPDRSASLRKAANLDSGEEEEDGSKAKDSAAAGDSTTATANAASDGAKAPADKEGDVKDSGSPGSKPASPTKPAADGEDHADASDPLIVDIHRLGASTPTPGANANGDAAPTSAAGQLDGTRPGSGLREPAARTSNTSMLSSASGRGNSTDPGAGTSPRLVGAERAARESGLTDQLSDPESSQPSMTDRRRSMGELSVGKRQTTSSSDSSSDSSTRRRRGKAQGARGSATGMLPAASARLQRTSSSSSSEDADDPNFLGPSVSGTLEPEAHGGGGLARGGRGKAGNRRVLLNTPSQVRRGEPPSMASQHNGHGSPTTTRGRSSMLGASPRGGRSQSMGRRGSILASASGRMDTLQSSDLTSGALPSPMPASRAALASSNGVPNSPMLFTDVRDRLASGDGVASSVGTPTIVSPAAGGHGHAGPSRTPAGPEDMDDAASQGSGMSGMEEDMTGGGHQADYRRGKRFKKLSAMLGSASVQRAARDFRWQALLANVAQVVSNLISFIMLTLLLHAQVQSVDRLSYTAVGVRYAHELFIEMVTIDNIHRGLVPNTSWYSNASLDQYVGDMYSSIYAFSDHHSSSYLGSGTQRIATSVDYDPRNLVHTWNYPHWQTMEYFSVDPPRVELKARSLWDLGNVIVERALEVHHLHTSLAQAVLIDPAAAITAPLRNASAPTNGDPYADFIASRHLAGAYAALNNMTGANGTNNVSITGPPNGIWGVPVGGSVVVPGAGPNGTNWTQPVLGPGVAWTDAWRFVLSSGPTQLAQGYQDTLLALVDRAVVDSNAINRVQLILMLVEGCAVATLLMVYMWWLQHRVTQQRYRVYGVFLTVPVGMIRALASRTITISQGSDSEEDDDDDDYVNEATARAAQLVVRQESVANSSFGGSFKASATGMVGKLSGLLRRGSATGMSFNTRTASGAASPIVGAGAAGSRSSKRGSKRRMVRNSRDSLKLLVPFIAWGITICIIYATGYYYLNQVQAPVNLLSIIDTANIALHRLMLYAFMACSEAAGPARETLRGLLATELERFKLHWDVTLYGHNSTTQNVDRRFSRIEGGVTFLESTLTQALYRETQCQMYGQAVDFTCPVDSSPFSAVTAHGLGFMVSRFVEDLEGLLAEPLEAANINSTRLAYIMTVGQGPLEAALGVVHEETVTIVDSFYKTVDQLHVAAMVLSWVLVIVFVFLMLRPFLKRNRGETTRIAKMLAQLPAEVDIEGLVYRLLLAPPALKRTNRRSSVSSLVADDPVLAAKLAQAEAQAEQLQAGGQAAMQRFMSQRFGSTDLGGGGDDGSGGGGSGKPEFSRQRSLTPPGGAIRNPAAAAIAASANNMNGRTSSGLSNLSGPPSRGGTGNGMSASAAAAAAAKGFPVHGPSKLGPSKLGPGLSGGLESPVKAKAGWV
ncbi:hypothetical protein HYH03_007568 [Edaphochlamys debaryana]|uniref:PAS domain-containing protein n=1 Tax=Edaphochlamys debaryana TaxID=47281 RepID=A0A835Y2X4_9CHLO|nr:hypothetical protein HYH03_007568 [Edaphochlamys debaryana]|eukprot:KAG2494212.1 hypothetical protein HYH03_007568 [Edaphochlamys debaryana]